MVDIPRDYYGVVGGILLFPAALVVMAAVIGRYPEQPPFLIAMVGMFVGGAALLAGFAAGGWVARRTADD